MLLVIPTKLKSQDKQIFFVDNFKSDNYNAATFGIIGNIGTFDKKQLENYVLKLPGVISFKIFYERRCLIVFDNNLNILELRNIFLTTNLDFDIITISTNDKNIATELKNKKAYFPKYSAIKAPVDPVNWLYPESYPKRINTGNKELDDLNFDIAQQKWIRFNPEEYKKMTGLENIDDFTYNQLKNQTFKSQY